MPYSPNWSKTDIGRYLAIKKQKMSDGMDEDDAQSHAARIVNSKVSGTKPSGTKQVKSMRPMSSMTKKPASKMPTARLK